MIETSLIALLMWLWVIERRLNTANQAIRTLKLDLDGLRAMRTPASQAQTPVDETAPLPEVTTLRGPQSNASIH